MGALKTDYREYRQWRVELASAESAIVFVFAVQSKPVCALPL